MRLAVPLAALLLACTTGKPPHHGESLAGSAQWWPPSGCAFRTQESGAAETDSAVLIEDDDELKGIVECAEPDRRAFDFDGAWLAAFTFVRYGDAYKPLGLRDDGETLTLDVERLPHCGGAPPPKEAIRIVYRVPAKPRKLSTRVVPAEHPPCPKDLP